MDPHIAEKPTRSVGNRLVARYIPEIQEKEIEHAFEVSEYELELLTQLWAGEVKAVLDTQQYTGMCCSADDWLNDYASYRLDKIGTILGADRVKAIVENEDKGRFLTSVFEVAVPESNDRVLYTRAERSAVFHQQRAPLKALGSKAPAVGTGWCWQTAEDYKSGKPVEHSGYATAEEALQAAQQAEDEFLKEVIAS
jgi:hypothetical protein